MIPTSKLHKHVHNESLWVRLSDAEAIEKELYETREENTRLRAAIAQGASACIYCSLPKAEWSKCKSGFPGCARGEDAMGCPELGASYYLDEAKKEIEKLNGFCKTFEGYISGNVDREDAVAACIEYEKLASK